jgi:tRNA A37 methylthiotransferase MiaB
VWFKTWGCAHNMSDSEYMMGQLQAYGYRLLPDAEKDKAQLWLLNSCTVKNPSQVCVLSKGGSTDCCLLEKGKAQLLLLNSCTVRSTSQVCCQQLWGGQVPP